MSILPKTIALSTDQIRKLQRELGIMAREQARVVKEAKGVYTLEISDEFNTTFIVKMKGMNMHVRDKEKRLGFLDA